MAIDKEQIQAAATWAKNQISDKLGDVWWSLLVRSLLAAALGIAALFWPNATFANPYRKTFVAQALWHVFPIFETC